jgi:excisionase family DNA binding protein
MLEALLSVKDIATYLGLSERTIYSMIKRGEIPYLKPGGQYRFDRARIDQWLQQTSEAQPEVNLDKVKKTADPLTKRLLFMGLLTKALSPEKVKPILVGGNAVEFYTAGGYATQDIDVVAPSEPIDKVLKTWGFAKEGRHWISEELGIVIEAPVYSLDQEEQYEKLYEVEIEGLCVYIVGIEDLVVDRLNAYVHRKPSDDRTWARELMVLHAEEIDWDYLKKRAKEEEVDIALDELEKELK